MKEKLKFKLDVIPARFGGGYKAKMCARTTVDMVDAIKETAKALNLSPQMLALHFKAALDAILEEAATTGRICRIGDYFTVEPHVRGRFDGIDGEIGNFTHGTDNCTPRTEIRGSTASPSRRTGRENREKRHAFPA